MSRPALLLLDAGVVLAFAAVGRSTHDPGPLTAAGVVTTAWPFLVGLACAWALVLALRVPAGGVRAGLLVWVGSTLTGMGLRRLVGEGTDPAFVVVATLVLGAGLLGRRGLRALSARRG